MLLKNSPGDGFEPPLKEPESFVLPLDDPGIYLKYKSKIFMCNSLNFNHCSLITDSLSFNNMNVRKNCIKSAGL